MVEFMHMHKFLNLMAADVQDEAFLVIFYHIVIYFQKAE